MAFFELPISQKFNLGITLQRINCKFLKQIKKIHKIKQRTFLYNKK